MKLYTRDAIDTEMQRQVGEWGEHNHPDTTWLAILAEEVGEVAQAILHENSTDLFAEIVQVAAVAASWLDAIKRRTAVNDPPSDDVSRTEVLGWLDEELKRLPEPPTHLLDPACARDRIYMALGSRETVSRLREEVWGTAGLDD